MSEVYCIIPREGPITWEQADAVMDLLRRRAKEQALVTGVPYEPSVWFPIFEKALRARCPQPTIWDHLGVE